MAESIVVSPFAVESAVNLPVNIELMAGSINAYKNNRVVVVTVGIRPANNVADGTVLCNITYLPNNVFYGTMADATDGTAKIFSVASNGNLNTMVALTAGHWIEGSFSYIV